MKNKDTKKLLEMLERGTIKTDEEFNLFLDMSDEIVTAEYGVDIPITDIRIMLDDLGLEGCWCEIYSDVDEIINEYDGCYERYEEYKKPDFEQRIRFYGEKSGEYDSLEKLKLSKEEE